MERAVSGCTRCSGRYHSVGFMPVSADAVRRRDIPSSGTRNASTLRFALRKRDRVYIESALKQPRTVCHKIRERTFQNVGNLQPLNRLGKINIYAYTRIRCSTTGGPDPLQRTSCGERTEPRSNSASTATTNTTYQKHHRKIHVQFTFSK